MIFELLLFYFIGSVPWGLIITKLNVNGIDIRKIGSGNIGATNVLRTGNKSAALLTLCMDFAKGALAVFIAQRYDYNIYFAGVLVVIGHIFPIWLSFKGGKGVATCLGVFALLLSWSSFILICVIWFVLLRVYAKVSVASMGAVIFASLISAMQYPVNDPMLITILILSLIVISRHKDNVIRLLDGKELGV